MTQQLRDLEQKHSEELEGKEDVITRLMGTCGNHERKIKKQEETIAQLKEKLEILITKQDIKANNKTGGFVAGVR